MELSVLTEHDAASRALPDGATLMQIASNSITATHVPQDAPTLVGDTVGALLGPGRNEGDGALSGLFIAAASSASICVC